MGSETSLIDSWAAALNDDANAPLVGSAAPTDNRHPSCPSRRIEARGFAVDYDDLIRWSRLEQKSVGGVAERHAVKKIAQEAGHFRMPQDCNAPE